MARKSGFVRRHGVMRRETLWTGLVLTQDVTTSANEAVLVSQGSAALLAFRPFTVVRTRGLVGMRSDQVIASENQQLSYGHCVVSDQAVAIGVTAIPTPDTDQISDLWYVYEMLVNRFTFVSGVGVDNQSFTTRYFDSKAMRKVEEGQDLISVVESGGNSSGISITSGFRTLIKLH